MDILLDKEKTSKNPQKLQTQKIQQPSIHINVRFYIISILSQGDKKENSVFYQMILLEQNANFLCHKY